MSVTIKMETPVESKVTIHEKETLEMTDVKGATTVVDGPCIITVIRSKILKLRRFIKYSPTHIVVQYTDGSKYNIMPLELEETESLSSDDNISQKDYGEFIFLRVGESAHNVINFASILSVEPDKNAVYLKFVDGHFVALNNREMLCPPSQPVTISMATESATLVSQKISMSTIIRDSLSSQKLPLSKESTSSSINRKAFDSPTSVLDLSISPSLTSQWSPPVESNHQNQVTSTREIGRTNGLLLFTDGELKSEASPLSPVVHTVTDKISHWDYHSNDLSSSSNDSLTFHSLPVKKRHIHSIQSSPVQSTVPCSYYSHVGMTRIFDDEHILKKRIMDSSGEIGSDEFYLYLT